MAVFEADCGPQYGLTRSSISSPFLISSGSASGLRGAGFCAGSIVSRRSSVPRLPAVFTVDSRSAWRVSSASGVVFIASVSPFTLGPNGGDGETESRRRIRDAGLETIPRNRPRFSRRGSHSVRDEIYATNVCSLVDAVPSDHGASAGSRPLEDLENEICELAGHIAAATCRWLLLIAEFDQRQGWAQWGVNSCAHWLSWRCGIGLVTGRAHVRVARRLLELPLVRAAFSRGELSYSKVRALARVATPETEGDFLEIARHGTGAQLEKLVRGYAGALAATVDHAQEVYKRHHLVVSWDDDGSFRLQAKLSPEDGALVLAALKAADETGRGGADALVMLARTALDAPASDRTASDPCEVVVHVDVESLTGDQVHERCELADGPSLAPETVRRLGCDGAVVRILERDGRPLSVGRRTRAIPAPLRRALRSRDGGCRFPGCTNRRFLHAHHIRHWARGGSTSLDNLVQLCSHHHRLVHEGGFCVDRYGKHGIRFRRPDGRLIAPVAPGPANHLALERQHRGQGLRIGSDTCRPRSAGDPLDYGIAVECLLVTQERKSRIVRML